MKWIQVAGIVFSACVVPLAAMSQEEKVTLKNKLKAAQTSEEMAQLVASTLKPGQSVQLEVVAGYPPIRFTGIPHEPHHNTLTDVVGIVEECFLEDIQVVFIEKNPASVAGMTVLHKYTWLNKDAISRFATRALEGVAHDDHTTYQLMNLQVKAIAHHNKGQSHENADGSTHELSWFKSPWVCSGVALCACAVVGGIIGIYYLCTRKNDKDDEGELEPGYTVENTPNNIAT